MKALIINCTLKRSPAFSNTGALAKKAAEQLEGQGFETEIIRPNDYQVLTGNSSDEGAGDQWPLIQGSLNCFNSPYLSLPYGVAFCKC